MLTQIDVEDAPTGEKSVKRSIPKDPAFWHGGFWDEYIEQQGRVKSNGSPSWECIPRICAKKFNQLGLPSLHDVGAPLACLSAFRSWGIAASRMCGGVREARRVLGS